MTEKAFEQMMSGLKQAKEEYGRTVFPDCTAKYYAVRDAIELLEKQGPVEPKLVGENIWTCGECGALLGWEEFSQCGLELIKYKYCPECGKPVKWNA